MKLFFRNDHDVNTTLHVVILPFYLSCKCINANANYSVFYVSCMSKYKSLEIFSFRHGPIEPI